MAFPVAAAGVALPVVVTAQGVGVKEQRAVQQGLHRLLRAAGDPGVQLDARLGQGCAGPAANAPADEGVRAVGFQKARQGPVAAARRADHFAGGDLALLYGEELKGLAVAEVLKNLPVFVSDRDLHILASFPWHGLGRGGGGAACAAALGEFRRRAAAVAGAAGLARRGLRQGGELPGQGPQGLPVHGVVGVVAGFLPQHQPGLPQHLQMLRDPRRGDAQLPGQPPHTAAAQQQQPQQQHPVLVGQRLHSRGSVRHSPAPFPLPLLYHGF